MPAMMYENGVVLSIDKAVEIEHAKEKPFRNHLGGSMIGRPCERELWYNFRWARRPSFAGRILRLFERGHLEEFRFVKYMKMIGFHVKAYSQCLWYDPTTDEYRTLEWETVLSGDDVNLIPVTDDAAHVARAESMGVRLTQWRISDVRGHFGGSLDGIAQLSRDLMGSTAMPEVPDGEGLCEFKTHNNKSFQKLITDKVKKAKPEHWSQMQIYMSKMGLKWALYLAVNKDTDALYAEIVFIDEVEGPMLIEKAARVIDSPTPPPRVGNHPSWHDCKWCDYKGVCHYGEAMDRNCRNCQHSQPVDDGQWQCNHFKMLIPSVDAILAGCNNYKAIHD